MRGPPLYLDGNDDLRSYGVTTPDTANNEVAAAGLLGLTRRLSAIRNGAAIHASLSVNATELAGLPGTYAGPYLGADLTAHLTTYVGKDVFETFGDGLHLNYTDARRVVAVRP